MDVKDFKDVIENLIDSKMVKQGISNYIAAVVASVNEDDTINVYIPPNNDKIITGLLNKTGQTLSAGDSVELCTKNGKVKNAWVAIRHGDNFVSSSLRAFFDPNQGDLFLTDNGENPQPAFYVNYNGTIYKYYINAASMKWGDWLDSELNTDGFYIAQETSDDAYLIVLPSSIAPSPYSVDNAPSISTLRNRFITNGTTYTAVPASIYE